MNIHFCFLVKEEIKNSKIWEKYFNNSNFDYKISIYSNVGYEIKNNFFKNFQIAHNIKKTREMKCFN